MSDEDFTKSRAYLLTDLAVKSISGLAIVVLGIAGWRLQKADQATRDTEEVRRHVTEGRERDERRYLPMLRSITEVDYILVETSANLTWPTHQDDEVAAESRLGTHLSYFGGSLIFPDGEPTFDIVTAADNAASSNDTVIHLPARSAVLMLAEAMRIAPFLKRMDHPRVRVRVVEGELVFEGDKGAFVDSIALDRRTVAAWTQWLPQAGMSSHELFYEVDLDTVADDLHDQLRRTAEEVVRKNADVLSPEYVKIRDDVLKSRSELLPTAHER